MLTWIFEMVIPKYTGWLLGKLGLQRLKVKKNRDAASALRCLDGVSVRDPRRSLTVFPSSRTHSVALSWQGKKSARRLLAGCVSRHSKDDNHGIRG